MDSDSLDDLHSCYQCETIRRYVRALVREYSLIFVNV